MIVVCVCGINYDYYRIGNDTVATHETDKLREILKNRSESDLDFIRGKNVFANRLLNDHEFDRMKDTVLSVLKEVN